MTTHRGRARRGIRRKFFLESLEDRRLLAYGVPGPVFEVAPTATHGFRSDADFAGRVTAVWEADDGSGSGVYARLYENGGHPLGDAFLVPSETAGDQVSPRVASSTDATIIAWWSDSQLFHLWLDGRGEPVGVATPLMGTRGISPEFEVVDLDEEGFTIYSQGFQLRRYAFDGTLQAERKLAPDLEGWTTVESADPARAEAGYTDNTVVTWSRHRAREEAGETVYDVQIVAAYLSAGFENVKSMIIAEEVWRDDRTPPTGMNPGVRDGSALIVVWLGQASFGPVFRGRELIQGRYGSFNEIHPEEGLVQFGGAGDGVPTAISGSGEFEVHFVRPEGSRPRSYVRVWNAQRFNTVTPSTWSIGPMIVTSDAPPGSFQSLMLQPTSYDDFWLIRVDASGGVVSQRFASTEAVARTVPRVDVAESDGEALVRFFRTGDLSLPVSFNYATGSGPPSGSPGLGDATPGVDYTPVAGVVTIEAGRSEAVVSIPILDHAADGARRFWFSASDPSGVHTASSTGVYIAADDPFAANSDLTLLDYAQGGLWGLDGAGLWRKLSVLDPVRMLVAPGGVALADFGVEGLWAWDADAGWRRINDVSPDAMIHGAGLVFLDYGPHGLWSWSGTDGWARLNEVDPLAMTADDGTLFVDFTNGGLWSWTPAGGYAAISPAGPHPEAMTSYGGVVYLDYGASGLWSWREAGGWTWINGADPETMAVGAEGLFVDYGPHGVWTWGEPGEAIRIMFADARSLSLARGTLYAAFDVDGLRRWSPSGGWLLLNNLAPAFVATSPDATDAIFNYGPSGLWAWNPISGWQRLHFVSPLAIARS